MRWWRVRCFIPSNGWAVSTAAFTNERRWIASLARRVAYLLIGVLVCVALFFGLEQFREARRQVGLQLNEGRLSQLRIALQIYFEDVQGSFSPQSANPPVSWRVKLLPYIEQRPLFDQYHFDQPWDSAANLSLKQSCPKFFTSDHEQECSEILLVTSGESDAEPVAANAMLLAIDSSIFSVPWTRPQDITFVELETKLRERIRRRQLSPKQQVWIMIPSQPKVQHRLVTIEELLRMIEVEVKQ